MPGSSWQGASQQNLVSLKILRGEFFQNYGRYTFCILNAYLPSEAISLNTSIIFVAGAMEIRAFSLSLKRTHLIVGGKVGWGSDGLSLRPSLPQPTLPPNHARIQEKIARVEYIDFTLKLFSLKNFIFVGDRQKL